MAPRSSKPSEDEFLTSSNNGSPSLKLLFNLKKDPFEVNNLSNNKKYQKIKNELLSKLLSHRLIHQERQLSGMQITPKGVSNSYGSPLRKVIK